MATDDLARELSYAQTYGYMPARTRRAVEGALAHIATLEAQLAAVTEERDLWKQSEATCDALYTKLAGELAARDAEGFVMVPVEATEAMWGAAEKESARIHHSQHWGWIYAAMIAARPNVKG